MNNDDTKKKKLNYYFYQFIESIIPARVVYTRLRREIQDLKIVI